MNTRVWAAARIPATRSARQLAADVAAITGGPVSMVVRLPGIVRTMLRVIPTVRALDETRHQFERPFVVDSSAAERTFGLAPTPWAEALAATVASLS